MIFNEEPQESRVDPSAQAIEINEYEKCLPADGMIKWLEQIPWSDLDRDEADKAK